MIVPEGAVFRETLSRDWPRFDLVLWPCAWDSLRMDTKEMARRAIVKRLRRRLADAEADLHHRIICGRAPLRDYRVKEA